MWWQSCEALVYQVASLAKTIFDQHLTHIQGLRPVVRDLKRIGRQLRALCSHSAPALSTPSSSQNASRSVSVEEANQTKSSSEPSVVVTPAAFAPSAINNQESEALLKACTSTEAVERHLSSSVAAQQRLEEMKATLLELRSLMDDPDAVSAYELEDSSIAQVESVRGFHSMNANLLITQDLLHFLVSSHSLHESFDSAADVAVRNVPISHALHRQSPTIRQTRRRLFHEAFAYTEPESSPSRRRRLTSAAEPSHNPIVNLITKLIAVLEHVENLPVIFTDAAGPSQNFQVCACTHHLLQCLCRQHSGCTDAHSPHALQAQAGTLGKVFKAKSCVFFRLPTYRLATANCWTSLTTDSRLMRCPRCKVWRSW